MSPAASRTGPETPPAAPPPDARHLAALSGPGPVAEALAARLHTLVKLGQGTAGLADVVLEGPPGSGRRAVAAAYGRDLGSWASCRPARSRACRSRRSRRAGRRSPARSSPTCSAARPAVCSCWRPVRRSWPGRTPNVTRSSTRWPRRRRPAIPTTPSWCSSGSAPSLGELLRTRADLAGAFAEYLRLPAWTGTGLAELTRRRLTAQGFEVPDDVLAALAAQDPAEGAYGAHRLADRIAARAGAPRTGRRRPDRRTPAGRRAGGRVRGRSGPSPGPAEVIDPLAGLPWPAVPRAGRRVAGTENHGRWGRESGSGPSWAPARTTITDEDR